jgi:Na+/H+ antiporter NhaD/arsenite permease-like protein
MAFGAVPVVVLAIVFVLIAARPKGVRMWQAMAGGALAVLLTGQIGIAEALASVNLDVIVFLLSMFIIGAALEESGWLENESFFIFQGATSRTAIVLLLILAAGAASAVLMNDTVAVIGTPLALLLARRHSMRPKVLLLSLAFAVTIGSVTSPIGNPQNLLIALAMPASSNPFVLFISRLFLPTAACLLAEFLLIRFVFFPGDFKGGRLLQVRELVKDRNLGKLAAASLAVLLAGIAVKIFLPVQDIRLTWIAVAAALPILLFSGRRLEMARKADWKTIAFFVAMFVLMRSVWDSGFFQAVLGKADPSGMPAIFFSGVIVSQFISNVPLVALYLPLLSAVKASAASYLALAAASTLAGSLTILGAASNVIIVQASEERGEKALGFLEFLKIGAPLTAICAGIYWVFLARL